jgi:hypothetical protein
MDIDIVESNGLRRQEDISCGIWFQTVYASHTAHLASLHDTCQLHVHLPLSLRDTHQRGGARWA